MRNDLGGYQVRSHQGGPGRTLPSNPGNTWGLTRGRGLQGRQISSSSLTKLLLARWCSTRTILVTPELAFWPECPLDPTKSQSRSVFDQNFDRLLRAGLITRKLVPLWIPKMPPLTCLNWTWPNLACSPLYNLFFNKGICDVKMVMNWKPLTLFFSVCLAQVR